MTTPASTKNSPRVCKKPVKIPLHAVKVRLSKKGIETYGRMSRRCDHAFVVDTGRHDPNYLVMLIPGYCREHGRIVMHRTMVEPTDVPAGRLPRSTEGPEKYRKENVYKSMVSA